MLIISTKVLKKKKKKKKKKKRAINHLFEKMKSKVYMYNDGEEKHDNEQSHVII